MEKSKDSSETGYDENRNNPGRSRAGEVRSHLRMNTSTVDRQSCPICKVLIIREFYVYHVAECKRVKIPDGRNNLILIIVPGTRNVRTIEEDYGCTLHFKLGCMLDPTKFVTVTKVLEDVNDLPILIRTLVTSWSFHPQINNIHLLIHHCGRIQWIQENVSYIMSNIRIHHNPLKLRSLIVGLHVKKGALIGLSNDLKLCAIVTWSSPPNMHTLTLFAIEYLTDIFIHEFAARNALKRYISNLSSRNLDIISFYCYFWAFNYRANHHSVMYNDDYYTMVSSPYRNRQATTPFDPLAALGFKIDIPKHLEKEVSTKVDTLAAAIRDHQERCRNKRDGILRRYDVTYTSSPKRTTTQTHIREETQKNEEPRTHRKKHDREKFTVHKKQVLEKDDMDCSSEEVEVDDIDIIIPDTPIEVISSTTDKPNKKVSRTKKKPEVKVPPTQEKPVDKVPPPDITSEIVPTDSSIPMSNIVPILETDGSRYSFSCTGMKEELRPSNIEVAQIIKSLREQKEQPNTNADSYDTTVPSNVAVMQMHEYPPHLMLIWNELLAMDEFHYTYWFHSNPLKSGLLDMYHPWLVFVHPNTERKTFKHVKSVRKRLITLRTMQNEKANSSNPRIF